MREYILHRDHHRCQNPNCRNKSNNQILQIHHLGYLKKDKSDRPSNLITLCTRCHANENHISGFLRNWKPRLKSFRSETFMSTVRWKMVDRLDCDHTYGYLTKSKRIKLGIDKTHYNDAFCIADGNNQSRIDPIIFKEKQKNNRSLEKFYDAKFVDIRDNKKKKGNELNCGRTTRNKSLNNENLRKYRGVKIRKGRRCIRTQRYSIRPQDIVRYENNLYRAKTVHNRGNFIIITNGTDTLDKSSKKVKLVCHKKSLFLFQEIMKCKQIVSCKNQ